MENLPNEVLSQILGFIHPVYDRLVMFSPVCHRWNEVIHKTPSLWEHFHLQLVELSTLEREIAFRCLREFNAFIKCIRVPALDVVFGYDIWLFIRIITLEMTNITCLDIPTFPWNLQQLVALKSAKNLKELNLYGFGDLANMEWTHSFSQPASLIHRGHLQLLKVKFTQLEVLKLSMNMLRTSGKAFMDFLNALKLKGLQISAYNNIKANIQMNHSGIRLLKCLLTSRHASIVSKLDLHYVSIGHKELRLLLKLLSSLRYLKLRFLDIYRCLTGYQYLESKSLEYFELENLPAQHILHLKCSMSNLRRFILSGCSNLRSLQIVSAMLQQLYLNFLPDLRSLHVTASSLKLLEVRNCESLISETINKVFQNNTKIENCTMRGHLNDFKISPNEDSILTNLSLWITDICKVQRIEVHCPTLKSFICNHHDPDGKFSLPGKEACIDLQCNDLVDAFIDLPRITSVNIKCRTITNLMFNVGEQKPDMRCGVMRIEAEEKLSTFAVISCILNRVEISAGKIDRLDFTMCRIKGVLKVKSESCVDVICMQNMDESQKNVDMIARCHEIREFILKECFWIRTVTLFADERQLCKSSLLASSDSPAFIVQEPQPEGVCSNKKSPVKVVGAYNCPCFTGLLLPPAMGHVQIEDVKLTLSSEGNFEDPERGECLAQQKPEILYNLDPHTREVCKRDCKVQGNIFGSIQTNLNQKDDRDDVLSVTAQSGEGHVGQAQSIHRDNTTSIDQRSRNTECN